MHDRSRESESIIETNWYSFEDNAIDKGWTRGVLINAKMEVNIFFLDRWSFYFIKNAIKFAMRLSKLMSEGLRTVISILYDLVLWWIILGMPKLLWNGIPMGKSLLVYRLYSFFCLSDEKVSKQWIWFFYLLTRNCIWKYTHWIWFLSGNS